MDPTPRASSGVAATLPLVSVGIAIVAFVLPWWDDLGPLAVDTEWPKVYFAGALLALGLGVVELFGRVESRTGQRIAGLSLILMTAGLLGFYFQEDNTQFAEQPFTYHVEWGFFAAGVALVFLIPRLFVASQVPQGNASTATGSASNSRVMVGGLLVIGLALAASAIAVLKGEPPKGPEGIPTTGTSRPPPHDFRIGKYPSACLRNVPGPTGLGNIATAYNGSIQLGTTSAITARLQRQGPISWSASGTYLAIGKGDIYSLENGEVRDIEERFQSWAWSPVADCLVGVTVDGQGLIVVRPSGRIASLLSSEQPSEDSPDNDDGGPATIRRFEFAADGRSLQVRYEGRSRVLDLQRGRWLRKAAGREFERRDACPKFSKIASESCSTDGRYVVGIQRDRLVLVTEAGTRPLAFGSYEDRFPEWGPPRTGVLFLRRPDGAGRVEVWFIPEGGRAQRTPFVIPAAAEGWDIPFPWEGVVDWSVSPPKVRCGEAHCLSD